MSFYSPLALKSGAVSLGSLERGSFATLYRRKANPVAKALLPGVTAFEGPGYNEGAEQGTALLGLKRAQFFASGSHTLDGRNIADLNGATAQVEWGLKPGGLASLRIDASYRVELFDGPGQTGACLLVEADLPALPAEWQGRVQSLRVSRV